MKQIILLNGPSSSGKSSLSEALQKRFLLNDKKYAIVSIDDFMKISTSETIYEDDVFEISQDMCDATIKLLKTNDGVIVDHVITSERIYKQFLNTVKPYKLLKVHVTCPLKILLQREKERGDRHVGSAKDSYDYLYPKDDYDLIIDTNLLSKEKCGQKVFDAASSKS